MNVGLQLYTVRELNEPYVERLRRAALAGYAGVELGASANPDELSEPLDEHGLDVSSVGIARDDLWQDNFEAYVATCDRFGCTDLRMGLGEEHFTDEETLLETAHHLDEWADRAAEHGLTFHYHNHDYEFIDLGDRTGYDLLVEATDAVRFELDVGWAGVAGADPEALLERIGDRVTHVHIKDMEFAEGEFVTFGEGDLDVEAVVDAATAIGTEWLLFENDFPIDPVAEPSHASIVIDQYTGHLCDSDPEQPGLE